MQNAQRRLRAVPLCLSKIEKQKRPGSLQQLSKIYPNLSLITAESRFYLLDFRSIKDSEVHFQDVLLKLLSAGGSSLC